MEHDRNFRPSADATYHITISHTHHDEVDFEFMGSTINGVIEAAQNAASPPAAAWWLALAKEITDELRATYILTGAAATMIGTRVVRLVRRDNFTQRFRVYLRPGEYKSSVCSVSGFFDSPKSRERVALELVSKAAKMIADHTGIQASSHVVLEEVAELLRMIRAHNLGPREETYYKVERV